MLNRSASLAMSTSVLKALPGKLDIKRHSPSILYLQVFFQIYLFPGKLTAGLYFKYSRYKVWKMHQNTSVADIDFSAAEDHTEMRDDDIVTVRTKLDT